MSKVTNMLRNAHPLTVGVNVDVEWVEVGKAGAAGLFGRYSYGRYGAREGIWRLLEVFHAEGVRVTFFISADDAGRHQELLDAIQADGHEVALLSKMVGGRETQKDNSLQLSVKERDAFSNLVGHAPKGWRAVDGVLRVQTLRDISKLGYLYDSSAQDDDWPYVMSEAGAELVELPTFEYLKDSTFYASYHTHERVRKVWREEFQAIYAEGGYIPLTLHTRGDHGSGRAERARVVAEFLNYATGFPGVSVMRCDELATKWSKETTARDSFLGEIKEPQAERQPPAAVPI
jgi:peptidoglycan/xylan/chitin deacetylase (PgdA/CDA1 family)